MKTARELLNELPEDIRIVAIAETKEGYTDKTYNSMLSFIYDKFVRTGNKDEENLYWEYVANGFYDTAREFADKNSLFKNIDEDLLNMKSDDARANKIELGVDLSLSSVLLNAEINEPKPLETKKDKTILEWFQELPAHVGDRAIKNTTQEQLSATAISLAEAIGSAFNWSGSIEGNDYWFNVASSNYPKDEKPTIERENFIGSNDVFEHIAKEQSILLDAIKQEYYQSGYQVGYQAGVEHQLSLQKQKDDARARTFEEAFKNMNSSKLNNSPIEANQSGDKTEVIASIEVLSKLNNKNFPMLQSDVTIKLKQLIEKL